MERIINWSLADNFIDKLSGFILDNFDSKNSDFSNIACVFGGKRPALFLSRALSRKLKKPFYPPTIFTIDDFIEYILAGKLRVKKIGDLEAAYHIYRIVKGQIKDLLKKRESFVEFLPWAREIYSFIEQLDLENIPDSSLSAIEKSAEIGYDIPPNINRLLEHMVKIRKLYHQVLAKENFYSRGRMYLEAAQKIKQNNLEEFKEIIFANFFYLHRSELEIFKEVKLKEKGIYIFSGSTNNWSVLKKNFQELGIAGSTETQKASQPDLSFYQGFDMQSQISIAHQVFKKIKNKQDSVIVLPQAQILIPLLTEISASLDESNVSMGYSLSTTPIHTLLESLAKAQESKKDSKFYLRDYLNLIQHPLVKNLKLHKDPTITRVIVHKLEELLKGSEPSSISGSLFLSLCEIEADSKIYSLAVETLKNIGIDISESECKKVLTRLHELFFSIWEKADSFVRFAENFHKLLGVLVEKSLIDKFALNLKVVEKLQGLADELSNLSFKDEKFLTSQIWEIFQQKLSYERIAFHGSPLKGTQILGLFETRCLSFENVIVVDLNEGILPKLKIQEPLIPREVMLNLGLNRLEKEEEIQRYQFNSLISSAKQVHLIYEKNQEKEKSRFLEQIFWQIQKAKGDLQAINVSGVSFPMATTLKSCQIDKSGPIIEFLKKGEYSATRINTYLQCSLKFYYQYVLGIEEEEDLVNEPQASQIGTFIHELLEETFKVFKAKKPLIDDKFRSYFFDKMEGKFQKELNPRMKSDSFLLERIIGNRLQRFLDSEQERDVEKIISLEQKCQARLTLEKYFLKFNYTIDRIDEFKDGSIVILDYKTGGADLAPRNLKVLENMKIERQAIKENIKSFQLPLYYYFTSQEFPDRELNAEFYNLRTLERKSFISQTDYLRREKILEICLESLKLLFDELFDPSIPFKPERDERRCSFCRFKGICF